MLVRPIHETKKTRSARRLRPVLDGLEDRVMLSTFKVNTMLDTVAQNLRTGKDASGRISLRSAIMAANAKPGADTIIIPAGVFALTIACTGEDNDATGDLDVSGSLTLKGKGAGRTIIDGKVIDRVMQILSRKGGNLRSDDPAWTLQLWRRDLELGRPSVPDFGHDPE